MLEDPRSGRDIYLERVLSALRGLDLEAITSVARVLREARSRGAQVLIAGNGGSASTASHMATDFGVGSHKQGLGIRAICLSDNVSAITATANDISYDSVFSQQLELLADPLDVAILISASGNSPNILSAAHSAIARGLVLISLTGFDGGALRLLAHHSIHVETPHGDYGPVEDVHLVVNHMLTELLRSQTELDREEGP